MKTRPLSILIIASTLALAACSKKTEPTPPPAQPASTAPAQPLTTQLKETADEAKAAAEAKINETKAAAEKLAAETKAAAEKAISDAKAAAEKAKTEAQAAINSAPPEVKTSAANLDATAAALTSSFSSKPAAATETTLGAFPANLTPASLTDWYNKANTDTTGLIKSLGAKAAELGAQASPQFKSLYDQALAQKKNFDDIYSQVKSGGLTQWASLLPKLQTSWADLSKTLTEAKALLPTSK